MTKRSWRLNLVIILMILARLLSAFILFREFFYYRMLNVSTIFLFYLLTDNVSALIATRTGSWNKLQKTLEDAAGAAMLFAAISGTALYLPLYRVFSLFGFNPNDIAHSYSLMLVWMTSAIAAFIVLVIASFVARRYLGYFTLLIARLLFFIYCLSAIERWQAPFFIITIFCCLGLEYVKYRDNPRAIFKKDPRF